MARLSTDARRAQLLDLGLVLFSQRAFDDVSIDDIAREAGVSKGLLYHYFGGKRALYVAVVDRAADQLVAAVTSQADKADEGRVRRGLDAYLDFVAARGDAFSALMRGGLGADEEVEAIVRRTRAAFRDRIVEGLDLGGDRPVYRSVTQAWLGAVEAASLDWVEHGDPDRDTLVELLLALLMGGMARAMVLDPVPGATLDPAQFG